MTDAATGTRRSPMMPKTMAVMAPPAPSTKTNGIQPNANEPRPTQKDASANPWPDVWLEPGPNRAEAPALR